MSGTRPAERSFFLDSGGLRLRVRRWGFGTTPVLFLHGMGANGHWWDLAAPSLQGLDAACLDFRGHGESGWTQDGVYRMSDLVQDIEAARRALGWESFHLVAHSMGARTSLSYAAEHPGRLLKLAAVDFLPEFHKGRAHRFKRTAHRLQPTYGDPAAMTEKFHLEPPGTLLGPEGLRRLARDCIKPLEGGRYTWRFDWHAFTMDYPEVWPLLERIPVETLIVRGEHSTVMTPDDLSRIAGGLPRGRAVEIAKAHHHVPLDTPGELAGVLLDFLG